ncbi:ras GTPase-activating protein-binding protein 2-like, partial [Sinocyclocheilus grahami]|uniref:ras GTPase-activating protein-binding protein 2-like n=1 Tax=Sinocyclocheilus grahami TaxID=75366 RepID=UPI0007AD4CA4
MVMEKPSPLLVGREFVRQYYTLLNKAPDYLHRFYGRSSSYVHGGVDGTGKPEEAVYGQAEIHKKVMSLQFSECHTKIRQVDAHATLGGGGVVQVRGELGRERLGENLMRVDIYCVKGSAVNKFYVHNDIFRYEEEVFGDSEAELGGKTTDRTHTLSHCGRLQAFSWALVTSKNLPPAHLVKAAGVQARVELKQDGQPSLPRDQRRERPGFPLRGPRAGDAHS